MFIDLILTLAWFVLVIGVGGVLVYAALALAPKVVGFVKWHISKHNDDDWYL